MKQNNKGRRRELKFLKYKKRLRLQAACNYYHLDREGNRIDGVKTIDLIRENAYNCYRTTSVPCSCEMCSYPKYERHKQTIENRKIVQDELKEITLWKLNKLE